MRKHRKILLLLPLILTLSFITIIARRSQIPKPPITKEEQSVDFEDQFPIVDFTTPEPADPQQRIKRRGKGKKYDKSPIPLSDQIEHNGSTKNHLTSTLDWESNLTALPVDQSQIIVVGEVVGAQAYLSSDKTGVYSEFTVHIEDILKNGSQAQIALGSSIFAERSGGRVRFPSGHITLSSTAWQGMPRIGRRYVLFLRSSNQEQNFEIITGYELKENRIALLDNPPQHPITANDGKDKTVFLDELRAAIASQH